MNKIYRLVFNRELGVMQVASEQTRSHGGASVAGAPVRGSRLVARVLATCLSFGLASSAWAQSVDYAAIFVGDHVLEPDSAANYDWSQINTWGMIVGYDEDSHVIVRDGLLVESAGVVLGHQAGVRGQMDLVGPNTTLTEGLFSGEPLYVGLSGSGLLNVTGGAKVVDMRWLYAGYEAGSDGTINVDGDGSEIAGFVDGHIGRYGAGTLNITNGGKVSFRSGTNNRFVINAGAAQGSTGTIVVDGAGSLLESTSGYGFYLGNRGTATLTVSNGGRVDMSSSIRLGAEATGNGTVEVSGAGSAITSDNALYVGEAGTGQVTVREGGLIDVTVLRLGNGSVLVEGEDTTFDAVGASIASHIGDEGGAGELIIRDGAHAAFGSIVLGNEGGASGSLLVTGADTQLTTGADDAIHVGDTGAGDLQVLDGASLSAGWLVIGASPTDAEDDEDPSGNALVSGEGTTLEISEALVVANDVSGTLVVENGASVVAGSTHVERGTDGNFSDTAGSLEITGAGTHFQSGEFHATAHFSVTDGALLETAGATVRRNGTTVAVGEKALVSGTDTAWTNSGDMYVEASVDIVDGAQVTTDTLSVGNSVNDQVSFRVLGDETLVTVNDAVNLGLGALPSKPGVVQLADGGHLRVDGDINFGRGATLAIGGGLLIDPDAPIAPAQAAGFLNPEARLYFSEDEGGSSWLLLNHTEDDYAIASAFVSESHGYSGIYAPDGGLRIRSVAGTTRLTGDTSLFSNGILVEGGRLVLDSDMNVRPADYDPSSGKEYITQTISVTGGELLVNGDLGFEYQWSSGEDIYTGRTGRLEVTDAGKLGGSGTIFGHVEVSAGGSLSPGEDAAGTLTIDGNLTIGENALDAASFFNVDILGNGQSDKIVVTGVANIDNGESPTTVAVTALDPGTSYQDGQQYTILTATGGVEGTFDNVMSHSAFLTPTLTYDANNVFLGIALDTSEVDVVVEDGEVLDGSGNWANIGVLAGGTVSPGTNDAPIGTIHADGDLDFAAGSFYDVDIKGTATAGVNAAAVAPAGSSDLLTTTGTATLEGGTVRVTALDAETSYQNGQQYTILSAEGGLSGEFADVLSRSAFLTPSLSYTDNDAVLTIALNTQSDDGVVSDGEVLSGTGSYDRIEVQGGGTVSPGDGTVPIGTISATGPVSFAAGSFYDVDIRGDGGNDLLSTTGAATLDGGTVRVTALDPETSYQDGQQYTILTADGGLSGEFASALSQSAFLTPSLSYTDNNALLTIALAESPGPGPGPVPGIFQTVAETRNQYNVAVAMNTLPQSGDALALYNRLLMLGADEARNAFGSLSGEVHASTRTAMLDDRFVRDGVTRRMLGNVARQSANGINAWIDGSATSGHIDSDGNGARASGQRTGVLAGVDFALADTLTLGVAAGVEDLNRRMRPWQSEADIDAMHFGVYADAHWGALSLRGGASHGRFDVDTVRHVAVDAQAPDRVTSGYDASATTFFAEGGWTFDLGNTRLTPYLAVAHTRLETDGTTEAGASTALQVSESKDELLTGTAGVRASWDVSGPGAEGVLLTAGLAWQNANGELKQDHRASLVAGGDGFTVYGAPLGRNTGIAELDLNLPLTDASEIQLGAQSRFGDGQSETGVHLQWNVSF